ncbi:hypothetical protein BC941DRAFT_473494 [Chlamydoabsidia padenii]|nr:hypothetical protein BC941DRAFT_473494 [Chlamydoabsidia padenii]
MVLENRPLTSLWLLLVDWKNHRLLRPTLYNYLTTREESRKWFDELFALIKDGALKFHIHKVYDLKDAPQAHHDLQARLTTGKLLIRP